VRKFNVIENLLHAKRSLIQQACSEQVFYTSLHESKMRMPFILPMEEARGWIEPDLTKAEIKDLMQPLDEKLMKAEVIEK
jgi:hypothetical protein